LIAPSVFVYSAQAETTVTSVIPSSVTASTGQNFSINVTVSNVLDLFGWEFKLGWNATLLDAVNAVEGPFLKTGGDTFFSYKINATAGYIIADCTLLGSIPGVSGNGTLAKVTFYVKNAGECLLDLYNVTLLNSFEQLIPCQTTDGYFSGTSHDVAVIGVEASPTTVLPGGIVDINVTLQNQGDFTEVFNVTVYTNTKAVGMQSLFLDKSSSATIPFTWNTTDSEKGEYTISASATPVQGEVNIADNNEAANDIVTILYPGHDVAVVYVKPFKIVVGQGYCTDIEVTLKNFGVFTETFETTTYANTTAIQTKTATLLSGNKIELTVTWNTCGFVKGNYTIWAYAWPLPDEADTTDNTLINGWVFVAMVGDVNADDVVDIEDVYAIALSYGTTHRQPGYKPNLDINGDGIIDIQDLYTAVLHYGETSP